MHRISSLLTVSTVSLFLLSSTCKKDTPDTPGGGPGATFRTSGYLVTMGINRQGNNDTLIFWFTTGGDFLTTYGFGYGRPEDELAMTVNSNNTMTIQKKVPHVYNNKSYKWFGIEENTNPALSPFPNNSYLFDMFHEEESAKTQFIIKRKDGDMEKFTIESKAYPGYFLGSAKWKNAVYPTETRLVFTTKAQEFWFMEN
jgi:hypothetical protein